jgi:hypothetical protein
MKTTIVLCAILLSCRFILAQQKPQRPVASGISNKQTPLDWFGVSAGPQLNYLSYRDKTTTIEGKNAGVHIGGFYQRDINKYFAIHPGLLFSIRGGKIHHIDSTINTSLLNIELPINFLFLYKGLMLGGGPNFCYGVRGQMKSNGMLRNAYEANESFERTLKPFELGANFMIGYRFKNGFFLSTNFSPGISNIYKGDGSAPPNLKANTRVFGMSMGYTFAMLRD